MSISTFELFSIGIGPSSSHTVGPMKAAYEFTKLLKEEKTLDKVARIKVDLYGSLALTGKGHATDLAVLNGLEGFQPDTVDPLEVKSRVVKISTQNQLNFNVAEDLLFHMQESLPLHANGLLFSAFDDKDNLIKDKTFYSIGGGFIVDKEGFHTQDDTDMPVKYPFNTATELLNICETHHLSIAQVMRENEKTWRDDQAITHDLLNIAKTMLDCIDSGCHHEGILPGGLNVKRRAPALFTKMMEKDNNTPISAHAMNWLNCYALAVNEENAAGGRVVTAPTNGAAGVIPAVLKYYLQFCEGTSEGVMDFILTAAAIAVLYKKGASISAAEVGCQGEVGVACSMAAGALTAVLGGTLAQIENAAEIGMEHHLGLTCDPIGGLVQIPCIERNAMGAVQAVNTAQLSLMETGEHKVSLDKVIATMLQTYANTL